MTDLVNDTPENRSEIIIYQTEDGESRLEVRLVDETVWLSLNQMAELFQRDKSVISKHIKNIFEERELSRDSVSGRLKGCVNTLLKGLRLMTNA